MDMGRHDGPMTCRRALEMNKGLLEYAGAVQRFDEAAAPVRRVELQVNQTRQGEFLFLAIVADGKRLEGRGLAKPPYIERCQKPDGTCMDTSQT